MATLSIGVDGVKPGTNSNDCCGQLTTGAALFRILSAIWARNRCQAIAAGRLLLFCIEPWKNRMTGVRN